jgi:hypothetical protein
MQEQLRKHAKVAAALGAAASEIEEQNIDSLLVDSLREWAREADEKVERYEHNIADATARLAIVSQGLPDPGPDPYPS